MTQNEVNKAHERQRDALEEAHEKTQDGVEESLTKSTSPTTLRGTERS